MWSRVQHTLTVQKGHEVNFFQAKSDDQLIHDKAWLDQERVWIVHKDGFSAARKAKSDDRVPEDKMKVQVDSGDTLEVDEVDVETVSPALRSEVSAPYISWLNSSFLSGKPAPLG